MASQDLAEENFYSGLKARQALFSLPSENEPERARVQNLKASGEELDFIENAYTKAIALRPDYSEACFERGYLYTVIGKPQAGLADFRLALSNSGRLKPSEITLMLSFFRGDELRQLAVLELQRADHQLEPLASIWELLARSYFVESRYHEYLAEMEKILEVPQLLELIDSTAFGIGVLPLLAEAYRQVGRHADAQAVSRRLGDLILEFQ